MKKPWVLVAATVVLAISTLAFVQNQDGGPSPSSQTDTRVQPIAFPHDTHAGEFQIDCEYCHFSAERSVDAGIPPVATCMGCHTIIQGRNDPEEVNKLRGFWQRGEAIPWVRIYKVADHVAFPHMRHVAAGMECQECHGEVQTVDVINERDPVWGGDNMGWCVDCHRQEKASTDCSVCHY